MTSQRIITLPHHVRPVFTDIACPAKLNSNDICFLRDTINLMGRISKDLFLTDDLYLQGVIQDNGIAKLSFKFKPDLIDAEYSQGLMYHLNDEFAALAESNLVQNINWDEESQTLSILKPKALFNVVIEMFDFLCDHDSAMAEVILSSAAAIYDHYYNVPNDKNVPNLSQPEKQFAITQALETIISSYENTDDFTVNPTELNGSYYFQITLGKNSDISFQKRFEELEIIYADISARESLAKTMTVEMWPCQTTFAIGFSDPSHATELLRSLYNDNDIHDKALNNDATMKINMGEIETTLRGDFKKKRRFKAFQH